MAKFNQMSSKKLNALLEDVNTTAEDKAAITEVLNARSAAAAGVNVGSLSPEESEAIASAEGTQEVPVKKTAKQKLTDEQRKELAEKLRAEAVNHRCEVVPFNSLEWVPGTVVSIIEEKNSNKVLYAVKTDDGRRIVKNHDSQLIKISDEIVEPTKKVRSNKKTQLDENGNPIAGQTVAEWTEEAIEESIKSVIGNVGKTVSFPEAGAYGEVLENAPTISGRIVSLVPNKRQRTILYRIELDETNEDGTKKYAHKVTSNNALNIAETLDEAGQQINEKFSARRYKEVAPKVVMTPEEAFKAAEASFNKAKESLDKAQAVYEKRQMAYEAAKKAYEESLSEQPATDADESLM